MSNTVILSGKGIVVDLIFSALSRHLPDSVWTQPKLKWWQFETRHELRIHNLNRAEIKELQEKINFPGSVPIRIEVI